MNTLHKLLMAVAACFMRPFNFANEEVETEAANNNPIPMVGEQFDFRKMVLNLLGCPEDATTDMVNERYKTAMSASAGNEMDADTQAKLEVAEIAHRANVVLKQKLDEALAANATPKEVKIKIGDKEVNLANTEEVQAAELAANERVVKAEAEAANSRQSLRKFVLTALVKEGRLTKAQSDEEEKKLSGPEFANAEQFDAHVATLAKRESAFGVATGTSIFSMLNQLGEAANTKGVASTTPSSEFMNMVNAEITASGCSYEQAWAKVKNSDKGKGLYASMKQPTTQAK